MISNKEIRAMAREQLGGNIFESIWLMALVVCLIHSMIMGVANYIVVGGLLVGGPMIYGCCHIFLQLARGKREINLEDLFQGFRQFVDLLLLNLLINLFVFLWSLLFIIPGIVKNCAYSMAFYIKHDNPSYDWETCMQESSAMMQGHKWQYFCLQLSFIGWHLVSLMTCGVGALWVSPYIQASKANFYEQLKNPSAYGHV